MALVYRSLRGGFEVGDMPMDAPKGNKAMHSHLLQFFAYQHLPADLQAVSKPFGELAEHLDATLPRNPEHTTALRKLLEAKDCAVRAVLFKENYSPAPKAK